LARQSFLSRSLLLSHPRRSSLRTLCSPCPLCKILFLSFISNPPPSSTILLPCRSKPEISPAPNPKPEAPSLPSESSPPNAPPAQTFSESADSFPQSTPLRTTDSLHLRTTVSSPAKSSPSAHPPTRSQSPPSVSQFSFHRAS